MIIAVDGPAASGKGTLARQLAAHFGYAHLDTGKLYRAVGFSLLQQGKEPADAPAAVTAAETLDTGMLNDPRLAGDDVARAASIVSAIPEVRQALLELQRDFATRPPGAVLDGRDIGTVICPGAEIKLFVTASVEERAKRRDKELRDKGEDSIYARVLTELQERDARDSQRAVAPLKPAEDAFLLDTTGLDADAVFAAALTYIEAASGKAGNS